MNRALFWVLATALVAVIVHFSYVLFAPRPKLDQVMASFTEVAGMNQFRVLTDQETQRLLPLEGPALVHAVCAFDVTNAPTRAVLPIPSDYWSLTVVTADGRNAYLLNDRRAGVEELSLVLRRKADTAQTPEEEKGLGTIDPQSTANQIFIDLPMPKGVIVLRALPKFNAERGAIAQALAKSTCNVAG